MKSALLVIVAVCSMLFVGCSCHSACNSSCGGKPSTGSIKKCAAKKCLLHKCNRRTCDTCACFEFMEAENPLGNPEASAEEKIAYAKLGYRCAMDKGMVPLNPRFGLPALDCPWVRSIDSEAATVCPAPCAAGGSLTLSEKPTERGYLLTAFDTPRGTRYVMIESERDFSPETALTDVEKDFNNLVATIQGLNGKVVIYLTNYPLITPRQNETSRVLRDLEINSFKAALQDKGRDISFVNWQ